MISTKSMMSSLIGAAILISTALPTPALAKNSAAQNAALDQMALQMYIQQNSNVQTQAILAQQQALANYNAAQAAWATQHYTPVTNVNYVYPNSYVNGSVYYHHNWHHGRRI